MFPQQALAFSESLGRVAWALSSIGPCTPPPSPSHPRAHPSPAQPSPAQRHAPTSPPTHAQTVSFDEFRIGPVKLGGVRVGFGQSRGCFGEVRKGSARLGLGFGDVRALRLPQGSGSKARATEPSFRAPRAEVQFLGV